MAKAADKIKCALIDYILATQGPIKLIATELPFLSGDRWADIAVVKGEKIIAYEVKSEKDTLSRLLNQIEDYKQTFSEVYVVISKKFRHNQQLKEVPRNIGILQIDEQMLFTHIRKPQHSNRLSLKYLSFFLWKDDLTKLFRNSKEIPTIQLRSQAIKTLTRSRLFSIAIKAILTRYSGRFDVFMRERGKKTTIEDLRYLTTQDTGYHLSLEK